MSLKLTNLNNNKIYDLPILLNNKTIIFENCMYDFPKNGQYLPSFPRCPQTKNIFFVNCNSIFIGSVISGYPMPNVETIYINKIMFHNHGGDIGSPNRYLGISDKLRLNYFDGAKIYITPNTKCETNFQCEIIEENKITEILNILNIFSSNIE